MVAAYRPKLLLGRYFAGLGKFNQAMHHFRMATKTCPERIFVKHLRGHILETALRAHKLDELLSTLDEAYGPELVKNLLLGVGASRDMGVIVGDRYGSSGDLLAASSGVVDAKTQKLAEEQLNNDPQFLRDLLKFEVGRSSFVIWCIDVVVLRDPPPAHQHQ